MRPEDRFQNSNFDQVFGQLESVHRVRRGCMEMYAIPSIVFAMFLFGVLAFVGSEDWRTLPICALPFLLLFCGLVRHLFSTRRDELRIYEHGFTYRNKQQTETCLWHEMKTYRRRERSAREFAELPDEIFPLGAVEKKTGQIIEFDHDLEGTPKIVSRFEARPAKPKPGSKKNAES